MPFAELAAPAIRYAREGVRGRRREQAYVFTVLEPVVTRTSRDPRALRARGPAAARRASSSASRTWPTRSSGSPRRARTGSTGARSPSAICDWVSERGGCLSTEDFAAYRVIEREPVRTAYRGREVLTNAPPSSGGILIAYALDLLERAGAGEPADDADGLALLAEVMEEANRVRASGDFHARLHEDGFAERFLLRRPSTRRGARVEAAVGPARTARRRPRRPDASAPPRTSRCSTARATRRASRARTAPARACSSPGTGIHLNNMLGEEDLNPLGFHHARARDARDEHDGADGRAARRPDRARARKRRLEPAALGDPPGDPLRRRRRHGRRRGGPSAGALHYEAGVLHAEPGFERGGARRARAPRLPGRALEAS